MKRSIRFIGKHIEKRQQASTDTDDNPCCDEQPGPPVLTGRR